MSTTKTGLLHKYFVAIALPLLIGSVAPANAAAINGFSGGSQFGSYNGTDQTIGWQFEALSDITVTQLGFWAPNNQLSQDHQVGIWTNSGTLLTSATVLTNSPLSDGFQYVSIAPLNLSAGQIYDIGAEVSSPFSDFYLTDATSVSTAPEVQFLGAAVNASSGGFSVPDIVTSGAEGRFGPNFQFDAQVQPVPEPTATPGLLAFGIMGAGFMLKRKQQQKAMVKA